jgi:hypothetical protein
MNERVNVLEQGQTPANNKLVVITEYQEYIIALYNHRPLQSSPSTIIALYNHRPPISNNSNSNSNMSSILFEAHGFHKL